MIDPYRTLGIASSATDDEVKKAYRSLSKKYHPDANINAPNKDELTEKFKEVQNAYDQIMDMRKKGYTDYQSYSSSQSYQNPYGNAYSNPFGGNGNYQYKQYSSFDEMFNDFFAGGFQNNGNGQSREDLYYVSARNYMSQGDYASALNILENIVNRSAMWYYYSAICYSNLGHQITALDHIKTAMQMDPSNMTYRQAYEQIQRGRARYRNTSTYYGGYGATYRDWCTRIIILNMLCNCCCSRGVICC